MSRIETNGKLEMTARKPKPTQLKDHTSNKIQMDLGQLFASANALVEIKPAPVAEEPTLKIENRRKAIKARKQTAKVGAPKSVISEFSQQTLPSEPVRYTTSVTQLKATQAPRERSPSARYLAWLLLIPAFSLFTYVALAPDSSRHLGLQSQLSDTQIQERLAFHRSLTGSRLNRERIDVQIQNHLDAPELSGSEKKIKAPDIMSGLPLVGEQNSFSQKLKGDRVVNPSHPDAQVMYGLQEEQDRKGFESQARKAWINEFIENARRDGYAVKIDKFGNVLSKKLPAREREPSNETGLNSSAGTETLIEN